MSKQSYMIEKEYQAKCEELQATIDDMKSVIESVNEHAETCSIFIWDGKGCSCYYGKVLNFKQKHPEIFNSTDKEK